MKLRDFFSGYAVELAVVHVGIRAAGRQQLVVIALLDDIAVAHDQNQVGVADGREAVRDDKARTAFHQPDQSILNVRFRQTVHA